MKSDTILKEKKVRKTKEALTTVRLKEQEIKRGAGKLGDVTIATAPDDIEIFFVSRMCNNLIENKVSTSNIMEAFMKEYKITDPQVKEKLKEYQGIFEDDFEKYKERLLNITDANPLWGRMKGIAGFTSYQLGLIMGHIKDIAKFNTPSRLIMYSGMGSKNGVPVTLANLNKIKDMYAKEGREFKGFNTQLSGRMFVIVSCLLRAKGYFYNMYITMCKRLIERILNGNEYEIVEGKLKVPSAGEYDPDTHKKLIELLTGIGYKAKEITRPKNKAKTIFDTIVFIDGVKVIMKNKDNQSVKTFIHTNACRRIARTLLHFIYTEWRTLKNEERKQRGEELLEIKNPYAIDYLHHTGYITLQEVLKAEQAIKAAKQEEKE